jgi:hypothetical protein
MSLVLAAVLAASVSVDKPWISPGRWPMRTPDAAVFYWQRTHTEIELHRVVCSSHLGAVVPALTLHEGQLTADSTLTDSQRAENLQQPSTSYADNRAVSRFAQALCREIQPGADRREQPREPTSPSQWDT